MSDLFTGLLIGVCAVCLLLLPRFSARAGNSSRSERAHRAWRSYESSADGRTAPVSLALTSFFVIMLVLVLTK